MPSYKGTMVHHAKHHGKIRDSLLMALKSHNYIKTGAVSVFAGSKQQKQISADLQQREDTAKKQECAGRWKTSDPALEMDCRARSRAMGEAIADQHATIARMTCHHVTVHITLLKIPILGRVMQLALLGSCGCPPG